MVRMVRGTIARWAMSIPGNDRPSWIRGGGALLGLAPSAVWRRLREKSVSVLCLFLFPAVGHGKPRISPSDRLQVTLLDEKQAPIVFAPPDSPSAPQPKRNLHRCWMAVGVHEAKKNKP